MDFKLFMRNIGHTIAFPFVISSLWISIQNVNRKAKDYENNPEYYSIEDRYSKVYKIVKKALFLFNIKIICDGIENIPQKPVLFIPNHKSNIDPLIFIKILYENAGFPFFNFIAKKEILDNPFAKGAAVFIDSLLLDRKNPREIMKILTKEEELIKKNSMVVFLEGTRIENHTIGEIKSAGLVPALNSLTPIIPIIVYGTIGVLKSKEAKRYKYKEFYVKFLKPIKNTDYIGKDKDMIAKSIQELIEKEYIKIKNEKEKNNE